MFKLTINNGAGAVDYSQYVDWSTVQVNDSINVPTLLSFTLQNINGAFVVPKRMAYVRLFSMQYMNSVLIPPQIQVIGAFTENNPTSIAVVGAHPGDYILVFARAQADFTGQTVGDTAGNPYTLISQGDLYTAWYGIVGPTSPDVFTVIVPSGIGWFDPSGCAFIVRNVDSVASAVAIGSVSPASISLGTESFSVPTNPSGWRTVLVQLTGTGGSIYFSIVTQLDNGLPALVVPSGWTDASPSSNPSFGIYFYKDNSSSSSITVTSANAKVLATGYITNEPVRRFQGVGGRFVNTGFQSLAYDIQVTSDEYLLNSKATPFLPAYVNQTMGQVLIGLANALAPSFFDTSNVQDGDLIPFFVYNPENKWSDTAKEFGDSARMRYKVLDKKIYFTPYGDLPLGIFYDETTQKQSQFSPQTLQTNVLTVPLVNDAIVIGQVEPQSIHDDYFVGDGLTANFPTKYNMFRGVSSVLLQDQWNEQTFDNSKWTVVDPLGQFVLAGALNCIGISGGSLGTSYILASNGVELGGTVVLQHGEVQFNDGCIGIIGGLYSTAGGTYSTPNLTAPKCLLGFDLRNNSVNPENIDTVGSAFGSQNILASPNGLFVQDANTARIVSQGSTFKFNQIGDSVTIDNWNSAGPSETIVSIGSAFGSSSVSTAPNGLYLVDGSHARVVCPGAPFRYNSVGDSIFISGNADGYNGTWDITSIVSVGTIIISIPTAGFPDQSNTGLVFSNITQVSVTAPSSLTAGGSAVVAGTANFNGTWNIRAVSGSVVWLYIPASHGFAAETTGTLSGPTISGGYNGTWTIASIESPNIVTISIPTAGLPDASGGGIVYSNIVQVSTVSPTVITAGNINAQISGTTNFNGLWNIRFAQSSVVWLYIPGSVGFTAENTGTISVPSTVVVTQSGASGMLITPMISGALVGNGVAVEVNHHYILQTTITARRWARYTQIYRTLAGTPFGNEQLPTTAIVTFIISDIDLAQIVVINPLLNTTTATSVKFTPKVTKFSFTLNGLPPFASYAILNSVNLNVTINNTLIAHPPQATLQVASLTGLGVGQESNPGPLVNYTMGTGYSDATATVGQQGNFTVLQFYNDTIPGISARIRFRAWETGQSLARVQDPVSITEEAALVGDNGFRTAILSDIKPSPRTSDECDLAAVAVIQDREGVQFDGVYGAFSDFWDATQDYPRPGRYLYAWAPQRNVQLTLVGPSGASGVSATGLNLFVRNVSTSIADARFERLIFQVQFGQDLYLEKQIRRFLPAPALVLTSQDTANPPDPQKILTVGQTFLDPLFNAQAVTLTGSFVTFDLGQVPTTGVEVRRADVGWGKTDQNLIGKFTTQVFSLSRSQRDQTYYMREVNGPKVSRFTRVFRVIYPFTPPPPPGYSQQIVQSGIPQYNIQLPTVTGLQDLYGLEVISWPFPITLAGASASGGPTTVVGSQITLVSDDATDIGDSGDVTTWMYVYGYLMDGTFISEGVALNGTIPVTTVNKFSWITQVGTYAHDSAAPTHFPVWTIVNRTGGNITVSDGTQTIGIIPKNVRALIPNLYPYGGIGFYTTGAGPLGSPLSGGGIVPLWSPIYRYENITFGKIPSDPALSFSYLPLANSGLQSVVDSNHQALNRGLFGIGGYLWVFFYNILGELSPLPLTIIPVTNITDRYSIATVFIGTPTSGSIIGLHTFEEPVVFGVFPPVTGSGLGTFLSGSIDPQVLPTAKATVLVAPSGITSWQVLKATQGGTPSEIGIMTISADLINPPNGVKLGFTNTSTWDGQFDAGDNLQIVQTGAVDGSITNISMTFTGLTIVNYPFLGVVPQQGG